MSHWEILASVGVAVAVGYYLWTSHKKSAREARRPSARHCKTNEAKTGEMVAISGTVRLLDEPLVSPFTARRCVHYQARLYDLNRRDHGGEREAEQGQRFLVDDGSGNALVHLFGAEIDIREEEVATTDTMTPRIQAWLDDRGRDINGPLMKEDFMFFETLIEEGRRVVVTGIADWIDAPPGEQADGGYREHPKRLRINPPLHGKILIRDDL